MAYIKDSTKNFGSVGIVSDNYYIPDKYYDNNVRLYTEHDTGISMWDTETGSIAGSIVHKYGPGGASVKDLKIDTNEAGELGALSKWDPIFDKTDDTTVAKDSIIDPIGARPTSWHQYALQHFPDTVGKVCKLNSAAKLRLLHKAWTDTSIALPCCGIVIGENGFPIMIYIADPYKDNNIFKNLEFSSSELCLKFIEYFEDLIMDAYYESK